MANVAVILWFRRDARFRCGGRGRGNRNYTNNYNQKRYNSFKGACEELQDSVYTVGDNRQADRYTKTTENIVNYIQRTYEDGQDVKDALVQLEGLDLDLEQPVNNTEEEDLTYMDKLLLQQQVKDFAARKKRYINNMNKAYALILGQCTQAVKNKLEAKENWQEIETEHDPIVLLRAIKAITQDYQDSKYPIASIHRSIANLVNIKQGETESLAAYTKRFRTVKDLMEAQHGKLDLAVYVIKQEDYDEDQHDQLTEEAYDEFLAYSFMTGADPKRSGDLMKELSNDYALGSDRYPEDIGTAASALQNYQARNLGRINNNNNNRNNNNNNNRNNEQQENKVGFVQKEENGTWRM